MMTFYRAPWPETPAPEGEPVEFLYEVDGQDAVPRLIEIYADGGLVKDSIENDPGPWGQVPSLVHGNWSELLDPGTELRVVPQEEFEALWAEAVFKTHPC